MGFDQTETAAGGAETASKPKRKRKAARPAANGHDGAEVSARTGKPKRKYTKRAGRKKNPMTSKIRKARARVKAASRRLLEAKMKLAVLIARKDLGF